MYTVITVALAEATVRAGAIVTTTITNALQWDAPGSGETRYHIGGQVLDAALPPQPVAGAWVELLNAAGTARVKLTRAGADGRFVFADVAGGSYRLRASSQPQGATVPRPVSVPEPSGNYDLHF